MAKKKAVLLITNSESAEKIYCFKNNIDKSLEEKNNLSIKP